MAAPSEPTRRDAAVAVCLVAIALVPFVVAIATTAGDSRVPLGDYALTDLRVRDVWSRDIPLVGAYSRFGWNHPGPAVYWLYAPISAVFGQPAWATQLAGALLQAVAIVAIGAVAWRAGRLPVLLAVLACTGLAYGAMGPSMVLDAWNANFAYPLFVLFVLLAWRVACADGALIAALAVVGSLLVQAHIGYLPFVVAAGGAAVLVGIRREREAPRRTALFALAAAALLWLPPLVHEVLRASNVRRVADSLLGGDEPTLGFTRAQRVLAEEFQVPPPWLGGHHEVEPFASLVVGASRAWLLVPVALLGVAWLGARRAHAAGSRELLALATGLVALALVALARVVGDPERYVFYWRVPISILVVAASAWSIAVGFGLGGSAWVRRSLLGAGAVIVASASLSSAQRIAQYDTGESEKELAAAAVDAVRERAAASDGVLLRSPGVSFIGLHRTVINELDRSGAPARVDDDLGYQFGYSRAAEEREVEEIWYIAESGGDVSVLAGEPGAHVLWSATPLPGADEAALRAAQQDLWAALRAAGRADLRSAISSPLAAFALADVPGVDTALVQRVADLNGRVEQSGTCRCAIVAFAVRDDPDLGGEP